MKSKTFKSVFVVLFFLCAFSGCASFNSGMYDQAFTELDGQAQKYMEEKKYPKAMVLYRSLSEAEPGNKRIRQNMDEAMASNSELKQLLYKSKLGSNLTDRLSIKDVNPAIKILCYIPNRIFDLLDIITLEIGPCFGIGVSGGVTEWVTGGIQASAGEAVFGLKRRHLTARVTVENFLELYPFETHSIIENRVYTGGMYSLQFANTGLKMPEDRIYQRARDFWSINAALQLVIIAFREEFHPLEIADFLAGFAMLDPLNDDLGTSRSIKVSRKEKNATFRLLRQARLRGDDYHIAPEPQIP
jgi:hypothetical protein